MTRSPDPIQGRLLISIMITVAMLFSVLIYGFVAVAHVQEGRTFQETGGVALQILLTVSAVTCALGGVAFFRIQLAALSNSSGAVPAAAVLGRLLRARIIGLALAEVSAILGLVLTLISGEILWTVALGALALGAMGTLWPQREQLERVTTPPESRPIEPD